MSYLLSFLIAGTICFIGQIIYDKTKLTPGHIVSILVVLGVVLSFFGIYEKVLKIAPGGAGILIINFGHLLYSSGLEGLENGTILNALMNLLKSSSATLAFTIFIGFLCSLVGHHE